MVLDPRKKEGGVVWAKAEHVSTEAIMEGTWLCGRTLSCEVRPMEGSKRKSTFIKAMYKVGEEEVVVDIILGRLKSTDPRIPPTATDTDEDMEDRPLSSLMRTVTNDNDDDMEGAYETPRHVTQSPKTTSQQRVTRATSQQRAEETSKQRAEERAEERADEDSENEYQGDDEVYTPLVKKVKDSDQGKEKEVTTLQDCQETGSPVGSPQPGDVLDNEDADGDNVNDDQIGNEDEDADEGADADDDEDADDDQIGEHRLVINRELRLRTLSEKKDNQKVQELQKKCHR
jgi:hypothetical protein